MNLHNSVKKLHLFIDIFTTLKWALSVLSEYKVRLWCYVALLMIQGVYDIYITSRLGNIIDFALLDDMSLLLKSGLFFVLLYTINVVITMTANRFASRNYNGMYNAMELKVYKKIMDSSWEEFIEFHSGDLITRLSSDIKTVVGNTSGLVPTMMSQITIIVFAGLYIVFLDYSMILVALVVAPIILIASRIFMGKIYSSQLDIKSIESRINSYNKETFNNIQAVKAFNLGEKFYNKMEDLEIRRKDAELRSNRYSICSWGISFLSGVTGLVVCIGWMFYRVHQGVISFGTLSAMSFVTVQIAIALKTLLNLIPLIMEYMASADRIRMLLQMDDEEDNTSPEIIDAFAKSSIINGISVQVEDMYFTYKNGHSIFEGANLEANPGEIVAIVGPSGEGKTTFLRILLGIVTAYKGRVQAVCGSDSIDLGKQSRQIISYVPQGNTMMEGTIIENMTIVNQDATEEQIVEALKAACIYDFIEQLPGKLQYRLGENGLGFSEGQNQRLSIARALLKNAPVLLLDEATSALDVATERKVLNNIMKKDKNKTIFLTTHRPTVLSMCNRVYRIANKQITVIGPEDIKKLMDEF